jgi:cytochrome c oxidase assembly factor CtaG
VITHAGHLLTAVHFLMVGYLFIRSLIGIAPARLGCPTRGG